MRRVRTEGHSRRHPGPDPDRARRRRLIEYVNQQIHKVLGYTSEELVGQRIERLVPASIRAGHFSLCAGFFAGR